MFRRHKIDDNSYKVSADFVRFIEKGEMGFAAGVGAFGCGNILDTTTITAISV